MGEPKPFYFEGDEIGVLLIHGFTGSPAEVYPMGEYLAQQGQVKGWSGCDRRKRRSTSSATHWEASSPCTWPLASRWTARSSWPRPRA